MQLLYVFVCQSKESHRRVGRGLGYRVGWKFPPSLCAGCSLGAVIRVTFGKALVSREILGRSFFRSCSNPHTRIVFICIYTCIYMQVVFIHAYKVCVHRAIRLCACALDKRRKHMHIWLCVCVCVCLWVCIPVCIFTSVSISLALWFFPCLHPYVPYGASRLRRPWRKSKQSRKSRTRRKCLRRSSGTSRKCRFPVGICSCGF